MAQFPWVLVTVACVLLAASAAQAAIVYDFGNPTAQAEQMRFMINRARTNPEAEADRLGLDNTHADDVPDHAYDVGEGMTLAGVPNQRMFWSRYQGARQVLAWNRTLNTTAANYADDMHTYSFFDHYTEQSRHGYAAGWAPWDRASYDGYVNHSVGENLAANNSYGNLTPMQVHNDFFTEPEVPQRGHRRNLLHSHYREIGVGYVSRSPNAEGWTDLWTVEMGTDAFFYGGSDPWPAVDTVFVTGVVYDDDGDSVYEVGEQKAGVEVLVYQAGQSLQYKALTASGGGYTVPLLRPGNVDVASGTALRVVMLDRQQHRFMDTSVTTTSGTVMFEDKETQSPTQYSQRFNVGLDGLWDSFSTLLDGDANLDHAVNVGDLGVLAAHWGQSQANWLEADFSGDGTINVGDLGMLAAHWGQTISTVMVPEPASAILLGFGLLGLLRSRAKRRSDR